MDKIIRNKIYEGHNIDVMKTWQPAQIDMVITSPPYYGLRNYKTKGQIWGGSSDCNHNWTEGIKPGISGGISNKTMLKRKDVDNFQITEDKPYHHCSKCGAWEGELGQEPTPELFIDHLMLIFEECRRILKPTGAIWINLSDSYNKEKSLIGIPFMFAMRMIQAGFILRNTIIWHKKNCMPHSVTDRFTTDFEYLFFFTMEPKYFFKQQFETIESPLSAHPELLMKQLSYTGIGMKEYAENQCQNPSDVKRRILNGQTKQILNQFTEYSQKYRDVDFDGKDKSGFLRNHTVEHDRKRSKFVANQIGQRPQTHDTNHAQIERTVSRMTMKEQRSFIRRVHDYGFTVKRNCRTVWTINTEPCSDAHFATFPQKLLERPIDATCPQYICNHCGQPREYITQQDQSLYRKAIDENLTWSDNSKSASDEFQGPKDNNIKIAGPDWYKHQSEHPTHTVLSDCKCDAGFHAGIVLDPFFGSGTTGIMAQKQGKYFVGIELNPEYIIIAQKRLHAVMNHKLEEFIEIKKK